MDQDVIYQRYLGAPKGKAVVGEDDLIRRAFDGANVTLNSRQGTEQRLRAVV